MSITPFLFFLTLGVVLLAIELVVFQLSTFWLFFVGIGALLAAAWAWLSPDASLSVLLTVFVLASAATAALLLKPLRQWQGKATGIEDNNAIGQQVRVVQQISSDAPGTVSWSGSEWQAELADGQVGALAPGSLATVVEVAGIRLIVAAKP